MPITVQVTFDCRDPHAMAHFWSEALGYLKEDHREFVAQLVESGTISASDTVDVDGGPQFAGAAACHDPDWKGPRLYFQKVPEEKAGKNRVHLDLHVGPERYEAEATRIESLGASRLWHSDDQGTPCWTMADIEGNEFCVD